MARSHHQHWADRSTPHGSLAIKALCRAKQRRGPACLTPDSMARSHHQHWADRSTPHGSLAIKALCRIGTHPGRPRRSPGCGRAGAIIMGKTNMPTGNQDLADPCRLIGTHPGRPRRSPGCGRAGAIIMGKTNMPTGNQDAAPAALTWPPIAGFCAQAAVRRTPLLLDGVAVTPTRSGCCAAPAALTWPPIAGFCAQAAVRRTPLLLDGVAVTDARLRALAGGRSFDLRPR